MAIQVVGALLISLLYAATPLALFQVGNLLYKLDFAARGKMLVSVSFFDGPPALPAVCLGILSGVAFAAASRRRARRTDGPGSGGAVEQGDEPVEARH